MNGVDLEYSKTMKYLGMTFDHKLLWNEHVNNRIKICKQTLMIAKAIVGKTWGATPKKVHWIWQCLARPKLTYGSIIWSNVNLLTKFENKLTSLQRLAVSLITHCMKSTPSKGLEVLLCLIPLHLYIRELALRTRLRIKNTVNSCWNGITKRVQRHGHIKSLDDELAKLVPEHIHYRSSKVCLPCDAKTCVTGLETNKLDAINIYTDGSKMDELTGSGWTITRKNDVIYEGIEYHGKLASVYQAEIKAIINACHFIIFEESGIPDETPIAIFSDSQSTVLSIANDNTDNILIKECKDLLNKLSETREVEVNWIKGHDDNTGNEFADYLAKEGTKPVPTVEPVLPITKSQLHAKLRENTHSNWQSEWESFDEKYLNTKKFASTINTDKKFQKDILSRGRENLNKYVSWMTGHCKLGKHLSKLDPGVNPICRKCNDEYETPYHIIMECSALDQQRRIQSELHNMKEIMNWKKKKRKWTTINRQLDTPTIDHLLDMINDIEHLFPV
jgi:ribonuclease HI